MLKQISRAARSVFTIDTLVYMVATLATVLTAVLMVIHFSDVPEVYVSHSTNECVEVKDPAAQAAGRASEWSCGNLPPRYEQVWTY